MIVNDNPLLTIVNDNPLVTIVNKERRREVTALKSSLKENIKKFLKTIVLFRKGSDRF